MSTSINQNFTTRSLLKFALPSIIMMVFMSCYTIVDGIFVSRFVGSNALSAVNIVYPIEGIVVALATMLATGGNAIISKHLGQGKPKEARAFMTQFILIGLPFLFCFFSHLSAGHLAQQKLYFLIARVI